MDPTIMLYGAIAALFSAYVFQSEARHKYKDKRIAELEALVDETNQEAREYLALLVMLEGLDPQSRQLAEVRETIANILRGRKGYGRG